MASFEYTDKTELTNLAQENIEALQGEHYFQGPLSPSELKRIVDLVGDQINFIYMFDEELYTSVLVVAKEPGQRAKDFQFSLVFNAKVSVAYMYTPASWMLYNILTNENPFEQKNLKHATLFLNSEGVLLVEQMPDLYILLGELYDSQHPDQDLPWDGYNEDTARRELIELYSDELEESDIPEDVKKQIERSLFIARRRLYKDFLLNFLSDEELDALFEDWLKTDAAKERIKPISWDSEELTGLLNGNALY